MRVGSLHPRRRGRRLLTAGIVALLSLLASAGVLAFLELNRPVRPDLPPARDGSLGAGRPARTAETAAPPKPRPLPPPYTQDPPYEIVDGATFGPEKARKTRLGGIEVPIREAICFDAEGKLWACGLKARAALNVAIRGDRMSCAPTAPEADGVIEARCRIKGQDVAATLVAAGFARYPAEAGDDRAGENAARRQNLGLWNGGWHLR